MINIQSQPGQAANAVAKKQVKKPENNNNTEPPTPRKADESAVSDVKRLSRTDEAIRLFQAQRKELGQPPLRAGNASEAVFDEAFYLAQNEDVAEAVERGDFASGKEHFELHGKAEGRLPAPPPAETPEALEPVALELPAGDSEAKPEAELQITDFIEPSTEAEAAALGVALEEVDPSEPPPALPELTEGPVSELIENLPGPILPPVVSESPANTLTPASPASPTSPSSLPQSMEMIFETFFPQFANQNAAPQPQQDAGEVASLQSLLGELRSERERLQQLIDQVSERLNGGQQSNPNGFGMNPMVAFMNGQSMLPFMIQQQPPMDPMQMYMQQMQKNAPYDFLRMTHNPMNPPRSYNVDPFMGAFSPAMTLNRAPSITNIGDLMSMNASRQFSSGGSFNSLFPGMGGGGIPGLNGGANVSQGSFMSPIISGMMDGGNVGLEAMQGFMLPSAAGGMDIFNGGGIGASSAMFGNGITWNPNFLNAQSFNLASNGNFLSVGGNAQLFSILGGSGGAGNGMLMQVT